MKKNLNNINAESLFHFTKNLGSLKNIIRKGLRFSYAFESFDPDIILGELYPSVTAPTSNDKETCKDFGVSIPMVCFCDIPLLRTAEHAHKYGSYIIGLDKDYLSFNYSSIINPVLYINSENAKQLVIDFAKKKANADRDKTNLSCSDEVLKIYEQGGKEALFSHNKYNKIFEDCTNTTFSANFLLALTKPYVEIDSKGNYVCYYDEREWRAFLSDRCDPDTNWFWGVTNDEHNQNRKSWNKDIENSKAGFITIPRGFLYAAITHIIVRKDTEIEILINTIMCAKTIFGNKDVSEREKLLLVSKITSFERIALDY